MKASRTIVMAEQETPRLPPLLEYPAKGIQSQLPPEEWQACLEFWIASVQLRLGMSEDQLSKSSPQTTTVPFLFSYFSNHGFVAAGATLGSKEAQLFKHSYGLLRKLLTMRNSQIRADTYFELLVSGSSAYSRLVSWKKLLKSIWTSHQIQLRKAIESAKVSLATSTTYQAQITLLQNISTLTRSLPETATVTVASADYIDTLTQLFRTGVLDITRAVTENIFYSFIALLENKHITILTDNIYHMKSEADRLRKSKPESTSLLSSLLCTTSFLRHFSSNSEVATRKQPLVEQLNSYRQETLHLHALPQKHRRKKGKQRAPKEDGMHMHMAAQVSQVHELFPDLSTGYILKVLDYYSDNVENVIGALLEPDSLPKELQDQNVPNPEPHFENDLLDLPPRSTPPLPLMPPDVVDNDDFDSLRISSKQIRRGKKDITAAEPTAGDEHARSKAAIISALAAFDSDDDERDDTYDVADVGGAVDNTVDTDERRQPETDANEAALFKTWKENPELFARDSKTRASNIRQQLKRETGMGDEQIEGWAIMLGKDKRTQDRLQDKYSAARAFGGQQKALQSTKWQASASTENSETESGPERSNDSRRMGQEGIRGHRNFGRGRGRGGSTAGPSDDAATQAARRRKEQGRGRGGANNRRDARAKKVGRGMGPLPPS
ncbi:hypothetical protein PMZ80_005373 [Knufia obscura]|uniref:CUE domain-containing protein n=1 Tax=Knufia obscura TaxID=1635080 RepID=A0ABR0RQD5_9EURO|nr:hypothetical protein PMZ80_005373 [Knufia obscura]